ncbi:hypothetical protein FRZ61_37050 [Hypericibacter adhaerens]|uniref:Uncharacterized protein n=2 Tax=Hypericibacter adhaerens TaxID=2602016 RepID=A0A5J6N8V0_9PROT|nr:hypothetical protein FRZ61_37050 [Hypericibacter adhaerens]
MPVKDFSTTAGSNTAISGINIAESCPAGNLNNALRQALADIRAYANSAEWFEYGDGEGTASINYASGSSFTIAGADVTAAWHVGRRIKASGSATGTIYGVIASSSFATNTTVNVTWDTGALQNESLTVWLGILSASNGAVPLASATAKGTVELATTAETLAGTDATRAVTPDGLAALWEKGADIASAATISIGEGGCFHVTGSTTITDIDFATDKAGRTAWLIFDGALTLTHHATSLILPTGANITTAAGDACLVLSEDGSETIRVPVYCRKDGTPVGAAIATASDMESASDTTKLVTAGRAQFHPGVAKAWASVTLSGGTPSLAASHNVSSVTDNATGTTTVNFATAFSTATYTVAGIPEDAGTNFDLWGVSANKATSSYRVVTAGGSTEGVGDTSFCLVFFGDQ